MGCGIPQTRLFSTAPSIGPFWLLKDHWRCGQDGLAETRKGLSCPETQIYSWPGELGRRVTVRVWGPPPHEDTASAESLLGVGVRRKGWWTRKSLLHDNLESVGFGANRKGSLFSASPAWVGGAWLQVERWERSSAFSRTRGCRVKGKPRGLLEDHRRLVSFHEWKPVRTSFIWQVR